jgi:anaerobic selenocysteine-containing dehydrogenase
LHEWEAVTRLAGVAAGQGPNADVDAIDEMLARETLQRALQGPVSPAHGADPDAAWDAVKGRRGPDRVLDILLRTGPYGEAFGRNPDGLTLDVLEAHPHGIDLGPLEPRIPDVLRTKSGKIELAPEPIVADVERLKASLSRKRNGGMVLVGRRQLRSNNSWMHNLPLLAGGTNQCTMHINPDDAVRLHVEDGKLVRVTSESGAVEVVAEVTDAIMPGVVSIPHGWGHDATGVVAGVAGANPGANSNVLAPPKIDPVSGNAVLNGIPVSVSPL